MNLSITDLTMEELKELIGLIKNDKPIQIKPVIPVIEKDLNPEPKHIPLESKLEKPIQWLSGVEFAEKAGMGLSTLYRYKAHGIVTTNEENKYNYDTEYPKIVAHRKIAKENQTKNLSSVKEKPAPLTAHSISAFQEWKKDICKRIELAGLKPNKVISDAFTKMTERYGIVWQQEEKEFRNFRGHRPYSTINTCYFMQYENPNTKGREGIFEAIVDNIIANGGIYYERGDKERVDELLNK